MDLHHHVHMMFLKTYRLVDVKLPLVLSSRNEGAQIIPVRATGCLCLLGIGVGLGSLLLYRIYRHLFLPGIPSRDSNSNSTTSSDSRSGSPSSTSKKKRPASASPARCSCCRVHGHGGPGSPAAKRRAVDDPDVDQLSPQSDQGYCTDTKTSCCHHHDGHEADVEEEEELILGAESPCAVHSPGGGSSPRQTSSPPHHGAAPCRLPNHLHHNHQHQNWNPEEVHLRKRPRGREAELRENGCSNRNSMYSSTSSDQGFMSAVAETTLSESEGSIEGSSVHSVSSNRAKLSLNGIPPAGQQFYAKGVANGQTVSPPREAGRGGGDHDDPQHLELPLELPHEAASHMSSQSNLTEDVLDSYQPLPPSSYFRASPRASRQILGERYYLRRQSHSFPCNIGGLSGSSSMNDMSEYLYSNDDYVEDELENMDFAETPLLTPSSADEGKSRREAFGESTVTNIEKIEEELQNIEHDINAMSRDVCRLTTKEDINKIEEVMSLTTSPSWSSPPVGTRRARTFSVSSARSTSITRTDSMDSIYSMDNANVGDSADYRRVFQPCDEYIWDYKSDLLAHSHSMQTVPIYRNRTYSGSGNRQGFATRRPMFTVGEPDDESPSRTSNSGASASDSQHGMDPLWDSQANWMVENIGQQYNIFEYADRHWRRGSMNSEKIRQGLHKIRSVLGLSQLHTVRRDHYCALRAIVFQALISRLPLQRHVGNWEDVEKNLTSVETKYPYLLQQWTFANRLPYRQEKAPQKIRECIKTFFDQMAVTSNMEHPADRQEYLQQVMNSSPELDLELLEGVKALMLLQAIQYHENLRADRPAPLFAKLMFSMEDAGTPEMLLRNHLNTLGDTYNIKQFHLVLLGHTLGVKIEVVRPGRYGKDDFISHYPADGADNYQRLYLLSEEEDQYNVLT